MMQWERPMKPRPVDPPQCMAPSIGARRLALDVLRDFRQTSAFAQFSLNDKLIGARLKPEDRRLVTSIVYGTLENQLRIDYALDSFMERPTKDPLQRDILRISAYQILFHDRVPDSAAVNEGVNLARVLGMESSAGFINAVLRSLSRNKTQIKWPKREEQFLQYLHIMGSMPIWIVDALIEAYGEDEAERIIMHRETEHLMVMRPNLMKFADHEFEGILRSKGWKYRRGIAPHAFLVSGVMNLKLDTDYRNGYFSVIGQSSLLAAEAVQAKPGMRILDACAAPGGKAAYLCESMQNTGRVYAWELHEKRALLLESTKRRLGLENIRISVRDATEFRMDLEGTFDAVLLDAPCSGLGVMAQKPDIRYRIQPEDIDALVTKQKNMLNVLCRYVKPNGILVYSTCSILPRENAGQIEAFLADQPEFAVERLPVTFPEQLVRHQTPFGLQTLGYRDDVEGFFITRLRKTRVYA